MHPSPETGYDRLDLLYARDEADDLLFVPSKLAEEILLVRERLPRCRTWGEARLALTPSWLQELMDNLIAPIHQPPVDDATLDPKEATQGGHWPALRYGQMKEWLPDEVVYDLGDHVETMLWSGFTLPAAREDEILAVLRGAGCQCELDERVPELFSAWD